MVVVRVKDPETISAAAQLALLWSSCASRTHELFRRRRRSLRCCGCYVRQRPTYDTDITSNPVVGVTDTRVVDTPWEILDLQI